MTSQAKSQVQVSIVASMGSGFNAAFQAADKRVAAFTATTKKLNSTLGDIDGFRKQQEAVKQAGYQWQAAKAKAEKFRAEIEAQGTATRKQQAELTRLEKAVDRTGGAFARERTRMADMGRALQQQGVHTGKLTQEYERLTAELKKVQAQQDRAERTLQRQHKIVQAMSATWRGIAGFAGGAMAAGAVLSGPTKQAMTYDQQLSYMADTAAAGKGPAAYQAVKKQISDAIDAAVKQGGGKRESAASALSTLIASGKFEGNEAMTQLPAIARTAFASGANPEDIAKTAIALKNFGINDPGGEFDKLLRAGQLGSFELKDMARWLPMQLALARSAGFSGQGGLTDLLAFNQVAMRTAGTQDEAGNNVVNLLKKMSSREFSDSMAKHVAPMKGDPTTKGKKGATFDWMSYAMSRREQGVTAVDAFAEIVDRQVSNDPRYQALKKKMAGAGSDEEKKSTLQAMAEMATGSDVGQLIADQQALMAALAALYGRKDMADLRKGIGDSSGAVVQSSANIRGETWAKVVDAENSVARANEQTYNQLSGPMGKLLDSVNGLTGQFPKLTTAAYGAAVALSAVAAFGVGKGVTGLFTGAGAGAAAGGAAGAAGMAGKLLKFGGPAAALLGGGLAAYSIASDPNLTPEQKKAGYTGVGGGLAGAGMGALAGGMVAGPLGALLGGVVGGLGGGAAGNWIGEKIFGSGGGQPADAAADAAKAASEAAKAAQDRPNVTQNNSYSVVIQGNPEPGALAAREQFEKMMREHDRKRDAELRGSFIGQPQF